MEHEHPTEEELRRLMAFHMPTWEAKTLTDHLRDCPACNGWYREMAAREVVAYGAPELR